MPVYDGINGVVRKRKEWPVGIDGVVRQQKEHWAGIDGVKRRIFSAGPTLDPVLNNNNWEAIKYASDNSLASSVWAIGDCKAVTVNGTVGTLSVHGTYYVYIIGFDHNSSLEGTGITFGTFKTALQNGTDICFVDREYNVTLTGGTRYFNMNHSSGSISGGWMACNLRYDILGSTNTNNGNATATTVTSPVSGTLMAALPSDLRSVLKPMTIYTDNAGVGINVSSSVTPSIDYLPLLSAFEILGTSYKENSEEQNYQSQYQYYKNGNSKIKYQHNSISSAVYWWSRSPSYFFGSYFSVITSQGYPVTSVANRSRGIAPIFRV